MEVSVAKDGYTVSYQKTPELIEAVFNKVMAYYHKYGAYHGECIMQSDNPQIEAAPLLADIADDLIKFEIKYND